MSYDLKSDLSSTFWSLNYISCSSEMVPNGLIIILSWFTEKPGSKAISNALHPMKFSEHIHEEPLV